jgi:phosphatidylserine/phosphatidylglycerophosphate/cardiolipin synthase-like enzyme
MILSRHRARVHVGQRFIAPLLFVFLILSFPSPAHCDSFWQRTIELFEEGGSQIVPAPGSIEVAFSPNGGATDLILKAIGSAQSSVRVAAYSFTSRPVANALIEAHRAGIDVAVVIDHGQISKTTHSVVPLLVAEKVPLRVDTIHALQHDKYMIIDGKTVETGSFNYTASAERRNSENVIVLWDTPALAAAYTENWQTLWDDAEPYRK